MSFDRGQELVDGREFQGRPQQFQSYRVSIMRKSWSTCAIVSIIRNRGREREQFPSMETRCSISKPGEARCNFLFIPVQLHDCNFTAIFVIICRDFRKDCVECWERFLKKFRAIAAQFHASFRRNSRQRFVPSAIVNYTARCQQFDDNHLLNLQWMRKGLVCHSSAISAQSVKPSWKHGVQLQIALITMHFQWNVQLRVPEQCQSSTRITWKHFHSNLNSTVIQKKKEKEKKEKEKQRLNKKKKKKATKMPCGSSGVPERFGSSLRAVIRSITTTETTRALFYCTHLLKWRGVGCTKGRRPLIVLSNRFLVRLFSFSLVLPPSFVDVSPVGAFLKWKSRYGHRLLPGVSHSKRS